MSKKITPITTRSQPKSDLTYRTLSLRLASDGRPSTLDVEGRSVEVVGATENPVTIFDYDQWAEIDEILLMSGLEMPESRQVPLMDTHSRYSTASVLGSYRDMRVEADQLMGRAFFSSAPEAEGPYTKVSEGHLTDFSVGYRQIQSVWVPDGETVKIKGRSFTGPVRVTSRWRIKELSVCPIGADEMAKARTAPAAPEPPVNQSKEKPMNERLRAILEARGLATDATEDEAWAFLGRGMVPETPAAAGTGNDNPPDADTIRAAAIAEEQARVTEITAMCARHECSDLAESLITGNVSLDLARQQVLDRVAAREDDPNLNHHGPAVIQADERDKFRAAAGDALMIRSGSRPAEPAVGADDLSGYTLRELARHSLQLAGQPTGGQPLEMIGRAMTTSDFPYILANVANKSLFEGWDAAEETWQIWCATGSVSDFKTNYSPRVSEASDLEEVPESGEYKYGKRTEAQESFSIATYGKLFAMSRQTVINDDLSALTDTPRAHGEAAARLVGDVVYAVLTGNAAMGDSVALFHADHGNLVADGNGGGPGIATLAAGILAMGTQTDLQGLRRLNIVPRFYLAPKALEGSSEVFFRSGNFADSDTVSTDSSLAATRVNPYGGNYLTRVYEPRLDDDDPLRWYLAAKKGKTVKAFFLNGVQKPYMETKAGWTVDGVEYKVRIDVGAKAMDWRGLYQNDGN